MSKRPDPFVRIATIVILLLTTWHYASAISFGFWWDDPVWYSHMPGRSWWQLLLPVPEFQYYRPGSMLYVSQFLRTDGTYNAVALHWLQIGWHLLQVTLAYAIGKRLKLGNWTALFLSLLVALFPFSYQATAWAAPNQPMAAAFQGGAWLFFLVAFQRNNKQILAGSLLLYFISLTLQESSVSLAPLPLLLTAVLRTNNQTGLLESLRQPFQHRWHWPALYLALAAIFAIFWSLAPRQEGITELTLDWRTAVYLLQAIPYPLLGRPDGYATDIFASPVLIAIVVLVTTAVLLTLAARRGRFMLALAGIGWLSITIAPAVVGLRYSYVSIAPRLLHSGAIGVGLLWVSGLGGDGRSRTAWIGNIILLVIALQSSLMLFQFEKLYASGTSHLQTAVATLSQPEQDILFINFPDRYAPKRPPYPLGYWGMTLAPIVVDLAAFPPVLTGTTPTSASRAMPWIDQSVRDVGPYDIDMRGVIIQPSELAQLAASYDAVFVTRYTPSGEFALEEAGRLSGQAEQSCMARFGDGICLHDVVQEMENGRLHLTLSWSTTTPLSPNQTIFVHLSQPGQPPLAQSDGDSWMGMLPLVDWPMETAVIDQRTLDLPSNGSDLTLQIGIYDRVTGERLEGVDEGGRPLPHNAYTPRP